MAAASMTSGLPRPHRIPDLLGVSCCRIPGRAAGYPNGSPTDPDECNEHIRFLSVTVSLHRRNARPWPAGVGTAVKAGQTDPKAYQLRRVTVDGAISARLS